MSDSSNQTSSRCTFDEIVSSPCNLGDNKDPQRQSSTNDFFENIWQRHPAIFHTAQNKVVEGPGLLSNMLGIGWDDVAELIQHSRQEGSPPLFFQQGKPVTDAQSLYCCNPFAAYLDACSIIVNHADFHSSHIANICNDLQKTFPHVYANSYLTPPNGHAVEAHADDRDVLVIQILGQKTWKVYKKVPIQFPFEKEQVGKNGVEVPPATLKGGLYFGNEEVVLQPGDVLYLPRGFVHEASTETPQTDQFLPSFHATIAIATHDWCLSVVLSETIRQKLNDFTDFRRALPIGPSNEYNLSNNASSVQYQLTAAKEIIQYQVTSEILEQNLKRKYDMHNTRAKKCRDNILSHTKKRKRCDECVGFAAASQLVLESVVRVSTADERKSVIIGEGQLRGLTVRQETCRVLMSLLSALKRDPSLQVKVKDLRNVKTSDAKHNPSHHVEDKADFDLICDFTLLSYARCCVELGALAVDKK